MYKAIISYDGTRYFGWQKTKTGPSIQNTLQQAIWQIAQESPLPEAASRTDRGVHAEGQVVQFALSQSIEPDRLQKALNAVLPSDIRIKKLELQTFHPTLDAIGKEYRYRLCQNPVQDPTLRLYCWHWGKPLNHMYIEQAAKQLLGEHDFTSFANEAEKNPICHLQSVAFDGESFWIRGDRFLYKMVRNLVGTLVYIGSGKLPADCVPLILQSKDRKKGGITAPAHGLYLHQVFYQLK